MDIQNKWAEVLLIIGIVLVCVSAFYFIFKAILNVFAKSSYENLLKQPSTPLDVDDFVNIKNNPVNYFQVVFLHRFACGWRTPATEPLALTSEPSPHVEGLNISKVAIGDKGEKLSKIIGDKPVVVVGTIRMGFGHHRIAYSTSSWGLKDDKSVEVYFHDFLNLQSEEADLIKDTDKLYSKGSRLATEFGGSVEKFWGSLMKSGDANKLRASGLMAVQLRPLLSSLPKDTPFIATHSLVALTAVAAGFTNVINLVIDNTPQWFIVVPGCLNLVQGPVNYQSFLKMGIPKENLQLAGHWCPKDMVENIPADCLRRIDRAKSLTTPRRILIPVGGAGAQRTFIINLVRALSPLVKSGKVHLFLNAGDHAHMHDAFVKVLNETGLTYDTVETSEGVYKFQKKLLDGKEPANSVTLFTFKEYFPAVATTDILCRVSDVLACKPSELAFYPVPKLMVRRVGDHEADSATRASELGEGTCEARTVEDALEYVDMFNRNADLLVSMNESIVRNNKIGVYDGCKVAVEMALNMKTK